MAARKQSTFEAAAHRRQSVMSGGGGNLLDVPGRDGRRGSITGRRGSIYDESGRRLSVMDQGRSALIMTSAQSHRQNIRYENTYQLEPTLKFSSAQVKKIAHEILSETLEDKVYNKDECTGLSKKLAETIKQAVKARGTANNRYKIVCIVAIGQNQDQRPSVSFTSRCIWNDKLDSFAETTFRNQSLYAVALVYALYTD